MVERTRVIIMGAAGRDFHNFNVVFRAAPQYEVAAFTAAQIPDIAGRRYPPSLSGSLYPQGIPIYDEAELSDLIQRHGVDWVYLSYSDLSHLEVMHKASQVLAAGASFGLLGPAQTSLQSRKPVVSVGAVRTGVGKSALSRRLCRFFLARGQRIVAVRHPMPYGDLAQQAVQQFASYDDLTRHHATIEEREEYEPYLGLGMTVYAGVDYEAILRQAETEADLILWDGGNNDFPFFKSDLHLVLVDPHRPGHEISYHPGETNLRLADIIIVNKADSASREQLAQVQANAALVNPRAPIILADSILSVAQPEAVQGKRVAVVGDGPTLTHGGMSFSAGSLAAERYGAVSILPGKAYAVGSIAHAYEEYRHLQAEVPALGYSPRQVADLEATLNAIPADLVLDASPVDLARLIRVNKPIINVAYELQERGLELEELLADFARKHLTQG